MRETLPFGTTLEWRDGALVTRRDRDGAVQAEAAWDGEALGSMRVIGPGGAALTLESIPGRGTRVRVELPWSGLESDRSVSTTSTP